MDKAVIQCKNPKCRSKNTLWSGWNIRVKDNAIRHRRRCLKCGSVWYPKGATFALKGSLIVETAAETTPAAG